MKKWTILVIVVLTGVLLFMQYLIEKKKTAAVQQVQPPPAAEQQAGVALPAAATGYTPAPEFLPQPLGVKGGAQISFPIPPTPYKGACEGGSLAAILSTHDRYWGYFARSAAFSQPDSLKMYAYLGDYAACNAAARQDVSFCSYLPQSFERGSEKSTEDMAPYQYCWKAALPVVYEGYRAGLVKDSAACRYNMAAGNKEFVSRFSAADLCAELPKGRQASDAYLKAIFTDIPSAKADEILDQAFPVKESACGNDQDCKDRYRLYAALKANNPAACPKAYAPHCRALLERAAEPCDKVLEDMSKFYCATLEKVRKATGGYIGLSKDELRVELDKLKAEKAEAEKRKKDQDKITEEINKRVRELKKPAGGGE